MYLYEIYKFFHILGVCAMLGATLCNGVLHAVALKSDDIVKASVILNGIMKINRYIMAPGFLLIIICGFLMADNLGLTLDLFWYWVAILITIILVCEFLYGYQIEKKLEASVSNNESVTGKTLPETYKKLFKSAVPIGSSATLLSFAVLFLMIFKPY